MTMTTTMPTTMPTMTTMTTWDLAVLDLMVNNEEVTVNMRDLMVNMRDLMVNMWDWKYLMVSRLSCRAWALSFFF